MLRRLPMTLPLAAALAAPALALAAPSEQDMQAMQQRIQSLEARLEKMQKLLERSLPTTAAPAAAASAPGWGESAPSAKTQAEIDTLKQKVARQELKIGRLFNDAFESAGSGLEITGYIDPTYVYNRNQGSASFLFLNQDAYTYYNATGGDVFLRIAKTLGEGLRAPKAEVQIATTRGYGASNVNADGSPAKNFIHIALATIPVSDTLAVVGGYTPSFPGYEYFESTQMQTVSHNLLYDFSASSGMVGVGLNYANTAGNVLAKVFIGNEEYYTIGSRVGSYNNRVPSVTARLDYGLNSTLWVGGSVYLGRSTLYGPFECPAGNEGFGYQCSNASPFGTKAYAQVDLSYTSADASYSAELDFGTLSNGAWNGGKAVWWGVSGLAHKKWLTRVLGKVGATVRFDYVNNQRNGGGNPNIYLDSDSLHGTDPLNGFGITQACLASDVDAAGDSLNGRNCKGTNRYALTLAFLAYPTDRWTLKSELRFDVASQAVFSTNNTATDGAFRRTNTVFSLQSVYAF